MENKIKKNHVGRPTNQEISFRKKKKIIKIVIPVVIVGGMFLALNYTKLSSLMGNSVSSKYYCENNDKLSYNGEKYICTSTKNQILLGDVNKDRKINSADSTMIRKYVLRIVDLDDTSLVAADVNKDGIVNVKDATIIQKSISGNASTSGTAGTNLLYNEEYVCPISYNLSGFVCVYTYDALERQVYLKDYKKIKFETTKVNKWQNVYFTIANTEFDKLVLALTYNYNISTGQSNILSIEAKKVEGEEGKYYFVAGEEFTDNMVYYLRQATVFIGGQSYYYNVDGNEEVTVYPENYDEWAIGDKLFTNLQIPMQTVNLGGKVYVDYYGSDFESIIIGMIDEDNSKPFIAGIYSINNNPYFIVPNNAARNTVYRLNYVIINDNNQERRYSTNTDMSYTYMNPGENRYIRIK